MRIAQVAPLVVSVPPHGYGGAERVVYELTEELVRLGHDVTLFASGDSATSARLIPMTKRAANFDPQVDVTALHTAMLEAVYDAANHFDVIHSHLDYLTLPFTRRPSTPTLLTLHGRLSVPEAVRAYRRHRQAHYVSISDEQRAGAPDLRFVATIHNAVDVARFPFSAEPGAYLAFVGRMSPEKGPAVAIEIAKRAGIPLKLAAKVDHHETPYFQRVIQPLLDHPLIEWLGEIDEATKRDLLVHARALLLPIDWPEPFGMAFIEALACGTPVLTRPIGSAPELLVDGVTGFSRMDVDALVAAARNVHRVSRWGCRAYAKRRFDTRLMAASYVSVYQRLCADTHRPQPWIDLPTIDPDAPDVGDERADEASEAYP